MTLKVSEEEEDQERKGAKSKSGAPKISLPKTDRVFGERAPEESSSRPLKHCRRRRRRRRH